MPITRSSGVLMPMSSLPSPYGIGTMGKAAYNFIDFLKAAGQKYWQLLPLGPTSYGDSPYASPSSFAGNPYYIDLDMLVKDGLLKKADISGIDWGQDPARTDYGKIYQNRYIVLHKAFMNGRAQLADEIAAFRRENAGWVENYALFMSLKRKFNMASWTQWPDDIRMRRLDAVARYAVELREDIDFWIFTQYLFFRQWNKLKDTNDGNYPLVSSNFEQGKYRRYAVTFVENHDTQVRNDGSSNGPLVKDTLAANAFMMAMPGTPCVFLPHWLDYAPQIKAMVAARKYAGITNESSYAIFRTLTNYFASVTKTNGENRLLVAVGNVAAIDATITAQPWTKITEGYHYAYYFPTSLNTAYADLPSGKYTGEQQVMLSAVTDTEGAKVVYTIDGSAPTAASTAVESGTCVAMPIGTTTLKAAILAAGQVGEVITRTYNIEMSEKDKPVEIPSFCTVSAGETCAFFEAMPSWSETVYCWAWDSQNYTGGNWPGEACKKLGNAANGNSVWKWTYTGTLTTQPTYIIFNNNGAPQTDDLPFQNGGYYTKDGLKGVVGQ